MEGRKIVPGSSFSIADRQAKYNGNGRKIAVLTIFCRPLPGPAIGSVLRKWLCDIGFGCNHRQAAVSPRADRSRSTGPISAVEAPLMVRFTRRTTAIFK